jgi:hypothetical protein
MHGRAPPGRADIPGRPNVARPARFDAIALLSEEDTSSSTFRSPCTIFPSVETNRASSSPQDGRSAVRTHSCNVGGLGMTPHVVSSWTLKLGE